MTVQRHIGDGAYAESGAFAGEVVVYADRASGRHWVSLEQPAIRGLLAFIADHVPEVDLVRCLPLSIIQTVRGEP